MVWRAREVLAVQWPTPDVVDAARFAVTEAGEVVDALLRRKAVYRRNVTKPADWEGEVADTLLMLLTVMGPKWTGPYQDVMPSFPTWQYASDEWADYLAHDVASVLLTVLNHVASGYLTSGEYWSSGSGLWKPLWRIAGIPGYDMVYWLGRRIARVEASVVVAASTGEAWWRAPGEEGRDGG